MKWIPLLLAFLALTANAQPQQQPGIQTDAHVQTLVDRMTDVTASVEDRWGAEDELLTCDPKLVLPALLEHVDKGMPKGFIYNGLDREHEKDGPPEWQVFYAVHRVWRAATAFTNDPAISSLVLDLLDQTDVVGTQVRCVQSAYWSEVAPRLSDIVLDPSRPWAVRTAAILNSGRWGVELREVVVYYMQTSRDTEIDRGAWQRWFERSLQRRPRHPRNPPDPLDPRPVRSGFQIIEQGDGRAYDIACALHRYLGSHFQPDQSDPKYQGNGRLTDAFFEDTVTNALAWWADNKARIKAEAAEWDARPEARGTRDAFKDLADGKLIIRTWGMPATWEFESRAMMQQRLGFTYEGAFCMTTQEMQAYDNAYNLIMESAIRRKHGPDWQDKANAIREEAKQQHTNQFSDEGRTKPDN